MVQISESVGRDAANARHDIAAIQGALMNVKVGNKPAWPGCIDGLRDNVLDAAIVAYQITRGIEATGRVETTGPTIDALRRDLPPEYVGMRGLPGTRAVYVPVMDEPEFDSEAR